MSRAVGGGARVVGGTSGDLASRLARETAEAQAKAAAKLAADNAVRTAQRTARGAAASAGDAAAKAARDAAVKNSRNTALKATALLATGGVVAGGLLYVDDKLKDADEKITSCVKVCLPDNWDDYYYSTTFDKSKLTYKTLEDAGDQPVCKEAIDDCGKYCEEKCTELHEYAAPGTTLLGRGVDAIKNTFDALNPFSGMGGFGGIFSVICVIIVLILAFKMMT